MDNGLVSECECKRIEGRNICLQQRHCQRPVCVRVRVRACRVGVILRQIADQSALARVASSKHRNARSTVGVLARGGRYAHMMVRACGGQGYTVYWRPQAPSDHQATLTPARLLSEGSCRRRCRLGTSEGPKGADWLLSERACSTEYPGSVGRHLLRTECFTPR